ncbi:MAG: hypothetical protein ACI9XU_000164 [Arenicella sp.]|jgi:hypothetical protein
MESTKFGILPLLNPKKFGLMTSNEKCKATAKAKPCNKKFCELALQLSIKLPSATITLILVIHFCGVWFMSVF